jgi:hypothetical protein
MSIPIIEKIHKLEARPLNHILQPDGAHVVCPVGNDVLDTMYLAVPVPTPHSQVHRDIVNE